ncbi:unnamed protein product, partial [Ectocarpus fasciculatus]
ETVFLAYTPNDVSVITSTMARLQNSQKESKARTELALQTNVVHTLDLGLPTQHVQDLVHNGVVRLNGVLSSDLCDRVLADVNENLDRAISNDDCMTIETGYGNVLSRAHRWDIYQRNEGVIAESLIDMFGDRNCELSRLFYDLFDKRDAFFHELAALVSDPGAASQAIHPDTPFDVCAPLYIVFVALQDVTEAMGCTIFLPGTNTQTCHDQYKSRVVAEDFSVADAYRRAVLKKGDCAIMDSRLLHCGAANSASRRALLYFTLRNPLFTGAEPPAGSKFE